MVRVLVHQRPDPEGRPDRRLSSAVECMVAIKNFGATDRGAGKFLHSRLRFGPEIGEKRRGVRPARRPRGCEVAVEHLLLKVSQPVGPLRPMAGHPSHRRTRPNSMGLWRTPRRCHRFGSCFGWPIGARGVPGRAALSGTKYSTWGGGYTRKHKAGAGGEMEGR